MTLFGFCSNVPLEPGHKESDLTHVRKPWHEGIQFCREGIKFCREGFNFYRVRINFCRGEIKFCRGEIKFCAVGKLNFAVEKLTFAVEKLTFSVPLWATVVYTINYLSRVLLNCYILVA